MKTSVLRLLTLLPVLGEVIGAKPNYFVEKKHFTTSDGTSYGYDFARAKGDNSTILFLHGWPSTRHDWHSQIDAATSAGYGIIAPDMLGYGQTDRPTKIEAYRIKRITEHLSEIIHEEGLDTVIGVGHDWGAAVLGKDMYWHPENYEKAAFLSVGYTPAGEQLEIDSINVASQENYGYMHFGYWYFFNSYDAEDIMQERLESTHSLIYPKNQSAWGMEFANIGAARTWLVENTTTALADYLTEEDKQVWMDAFSLKGSFASSLATYKSLMRGVQAEDEANITDEEKEIHVPVLGVGGVKDLVTRADQIDQGIKQFAKAGYTIRTLDTGHWIAFEDPEGLNSILLEFFQS